MLEAIQGGGVLVLLSIFLAYLLAPGVAAIRRRVRIGRRNRPVSVVAALACIYAGVFLPAAIVWHLFSDRVTNWVHVTAPQSVERLFSGGDLRAVDRSLNGARLPPLVQTTIRRGVERSVSYIEREARGTLRDLIEAAPYAPWLFVTPVLAFVLLTAAPGFQRSALRVLPHGHLQWRGEEYLRDVNSALAGYVRAQAAAAVVVGVVCVVAFTLIGADSAVSMGVTAGVLELVPGIGPLTAALVAITRETHHTLAIIVFLSGWRIVQDYLIYPLLIRRGMHLSTPAVIVTLWLGAALAGAAGVVLAIPIAGCLSVSVRHWREYRDIERLVRDHERSSRIDV
jgi:predicted PurR-regulated permease PerM